MPAPGDQHKSSGAAGQNPFEEIKPQISAYTAQEIATLQARLNKRLGPEYIATRSGPGNSRVAYLSAEKAINLANEVFGFNGWSSSIQNIQIDFVDENPTKGTISIGLSVVVRVTLRDGTYHEDTGYGGIENCKSKITAFEKAKKEGTTDALKRALRNFGNVLGNCIYDKDYIAKVSKLKAGAGKWDPTQLHRHADWTPKTEPIDLKPTRNVSNQPAPQQIPNLLPEESFDVNEFDEADFDDLENPDEVMLPLEPGVQRGGPNLVPTRQLSHNPNTPSKTPAIRPESQKPDNPALSIQRTDVRMINTRAGYPQQSNPQISRSLSPISTSEHFTLPQAPSGSQSIGFFSARAADGLDGNNNPTGSIVTPKFNPYAESPSIRKTSGVDHSRSLALNRTTLKPEPLVSKDEVVQPAKPGVEQARRLGAPGQAGPGLMSPSMPRMSTSAYRPPTRQSHQNNTNSPSTVQGGGEKPHQLMKRAPLGEVSNIHHEIPKPDAEGGDLKRQRIRPSLSGHSERQNTAAAPG